MPNLPTLTVTAEQADRLLAIFGDAEAYRAWLKDAIKTYVIAQERHRVFRTEQEDREARIQQMVTDLFPAEEEATP